MLEEETSGPGSSTAIGDWTFKGNGAEATESGGREGDGMKGRPFQAKMEGVHRHGLLYRRNNMREMGHCSEKA
jgi:hypothetical protein